MEIDGHLFLDLFPHDLSSEESGFWKFHYLKSLTFLHVQEIGPRLKIRIMNPTWIKNLLQNDPGTIQATLVDDRPILTAPTGDLQKFLATLVEIQPADDDGPFGKPTDLGRKD
ncbi:MAG: hypothetical protein GWO24_15255 [Akkermansiaceae bacterium]|nr:hypothetical protein [Akkermansiaceae bacterium]